MLITVLLVALTCFLYLLNVYFCHRRLTRTIRLPGPRNHFFFGNTKELWSTKFFSRLLQTWTQRYGKTYVYFEGQVPVYVSSDEEFLKQVFVKQFFSNFVERKKTPFERQVDERLTNLVSANGVSWKHQRQIINPAFSSGKLNGMSGTMNACLDEFFELIEQHKQNEFDIVDMYKRLVLDILLQCEYGTKTDAQTNPKNPYITAITGFFDVDLRLNVFAKAGVLVPKLADAFLGVCMKLYRSAARWQLIQPVPVDWVIQSTEKMIRERLKETDRHADRCDLVQLLVDARTEDSTDPQTKLTDNEIVSNCVIFLLAGFESTSSTLAYCTYILATNIQEQRKLQDEIDANWSDEYDSLYNHLNSAFNYLDLFIQETLRVFPIGNIACTRRCVASTEVCGIPVEEDSVVQMDMYSLHYSPELWGPVDPNLFHPDRHREKRHRLAFTAFGCGPKGCVGQRFAVFIIKLTLVRLLRRYNILPGAEMEHRLDIRERSTITPGAVWIRIQRRSL